MIEHNSEVYNHPYISFFIVHVLWKKISVGVVVYFTVMFDHPSCFLTFCRSGIPTSCYIFKCFFITCNYYSLIIDFIICMTDYIILAMLTDYQSFSTQL